MDFRKIWGTAGKVYDELMYQGYAGSRLTGINLSTKKASSVVRNAKLYKYMMTLIYGFVIAITLFIGVSYKQELSGLSITLFFWVYVLIFISAFQISFSVSSSPHIRDFLLTLPISQDEVEQISSLSILRSVDAPLLVSLILPAIVGLYSGIETSINYVVASLMAICLALLTDVLLSAGFRRVTIGGKASGLMRAFSILPVVILASVAYDLPVFISQHWVWIFSYVPVLDLYWTNPTAVLTAMAYCLIFLVAAYLGFRRQAIYLLTPEEYVGKSFSGEMSFKVSRPIFAIISLDFRQAMRSRLAGILVIPFLYFFMALVSAFSARSMIIKDFSVFLIAYVVPMVFASAMLGYALYASEARGQAAFRVLPISKFKNMASKALVTMGTYSAVAVLMSILMVYFGKPAYALPIIFMDFPLFSAAAFAGLYFDRVYKGGGGGMASPVTAVLYALGIVVIMGLPIGLYAASSIITSNQLLASSVLAITSLIESAPLVYLLTK